ncbi:hypothetical protein SB783_28600 [Paraburkholderia sp. SIMBA_009]|uniref:Uncharacterized protein n=1 Tax=Paraburkholderia tropica TaxID=92647 RepID=A0AAQ1GNC9_9BURK|nr:hypothetical protein [Paraburkholderia tropica]RQN34349.1 hypothetical protein EHZ25_34990 [Paraburkholderia tropica]SEK14235.1 hypothetical protein SAMN05216550_12753 [Paraburkholderia tropica]
MYSVDDYFVECLVEHSAGDGWTACARISRKRDYRKAADVPKALFETSVECPTKRDAERAAVKWVRSQLPKRREEFEEALDAPSGVLEVSGRQ